MKINIPKIFPPVLRATTVIAVLFLLQCAVQAAGPSESASLTVLVTRTNGALISGASVCVAASSGPVRSALTSIAGQVTFSDVPAGRVTITVSSRGFTGQSHTSTLPAGGGSARFILSEGSGGPVCTVIAPPPSRTTPTLVVTSFDWHVNRRTPLFFEIALSFAATRTPGGPLIPTHYRVGESSTLSGAQWLAYTGGVITFELRYRGDSLTAYGQRTIYFQVKQNDLTSPIVSKSVDLQPVRLSEFRFEGPSLSALLDLMNASGFHPGVRTVSATQNHCPEIQLENLRIGISNGYLPDRAWEKISQISLTDSSTKRFTPGWRVKSIEVGDSQELAREVARTISGQGDGNGFRVTIHLSAGPKNFGHDNPCFQNFFPLRAIVLEGPADDLALDQAKRWKNMFPPN